MPSKSYSNDSQIGIAPSDQDFADLTPKPVRFIDFDLNGFAEHKI
jgi:hypothetical protein